MSKSAQEIFIEIKDKVQKDKILSDLARRSMPIKVKGLSPNSHLFEASPRSLDQWILTCKIVELSKDWTHDNSVIVQFDHYDEKYVTQVHYKINEDLLLLDFSADLFRVQRREDYRLKIPRSFKASIQFQINDHLLELQILDLSAGGCRIEIDSKIQLEKNKKISIEIKTESHNSIHALAQIRHLEKISEKSYSAGLQFIEQTEIQKNRIAALVMDLYRAFFKSRTEK